MKQLLIVLAIVLMASTCLAIDWYYPNQRTIAWDAVDLEGVTYNVYICEFGNYDSKALLGNTSELIYVVTVPGDGKSYIAGVSSVLEGGESDINWSDVNGEFTPNPFGFRTLSAPKNLRQEEPK